MDADTYEFRAYRLRGERSVTRFELRPFDGLAAIFLQIAVDEDEHKTVVEDVKTTVDRKRQRNHTVDGLGKVESRRKHRSNC